jgi:SAM-dependent methyltransferase
VDGAVPVWTGRAFEVRGQRVPVLDYGAGASGYSEALTDFHDAVSADGRHPIEVASRRHARGALQRWLRPGGGPLLEVGCASGFLLRELRQDWPTRLVIGSDYLRAPLLRLAAQLARVPLVRCNLVTCPLPSASLDAVVLLNVLEHIEDEAAAVAQVARLLTPGGVAVVEVPAGPHLFDAYDAYLQHVRRYTLAGLCAVLEGAGLRVVARSHLGCLVYPAFVWAKRRVSTGPPGAHVARQIAASASPLVGAAFWLESALGRVVRYPVGIRCVVTAVQPGP